MLNRVLFLIEKYCDTDPKCGPTNAESMVVGAIRSTGLAGELKHFYYDVLAKSLGRERMTQVLLQDCDLFRPEAIVYTPMGGLLGLQVNPLDGWLPGSQEFLVELHRRGIVVYSHLWDTIGRDEETLQRNIAVSDFVGEVASNADRFGEDPRVLQVYSAVDPGAFQDRGLPRDIDVVFIGAVDPSGQRWPQRIRHLNYLRDSGVNVLVAGGQRQGRLSWEEYAGYLNRAKISLNFSLDPPTGTSQIKGRVFETMACGAMLLEDSGNQTCRFFEPGKDFVRFGSQEDLLNRVRYYLQHDGEREQIAHSGREKVSQVYNALNMWGYVFEKMGFGPPDWLAADPSYQTHKEVLDGLRKGNRGRLPPS